MSWFRQVTFRLQPFWRRRKIETGLSEEIESHIAMATEANIAAGMSPREARYAALREFGGVEQVKEEYRDVRGIRWLDETFGDIRIAARSLRKSPGFTTVAVFTLALCIGANSAVFSVVHTILLKPYPWPDSDRLVYLWNGRTGVTVPDYFDRRDGVTALEESALTSWFYRVIASTEATPERIMVLAVTPSLFSLLTARPALGRTFIDEDTKVGAPKTVVLSDALWRNRFGANPQILGSDIRLDGELHAVIGVMPPTFYYPSPTTQLWLPAVFTDREKSDSIRATASGWVMVGRLKRGATLEQAQRELTAIQKANMDRFPQFKALWEAGGPGGTVERFLERNVKDVRTMLWLLQGAVAAVLLIGCANVASLLLARASARERELAIRAALGAGRVRLMRHLLTESVLLFVVGGLLGLLVAAWGISAMNTLGVQNLPRSTGVSLDVTVFVFTLLGAILTGLAFGLLPAWSATRGDTAGALKDAGARATTGRRHLSLRSTLVVTEIALALMLLATAALLIKSFHHVQEVSPGFVRENLLTASFPLRGAKYNTSEKQTLFLNHLLERVRALPGVTSAATGPLPFVSASGTSSYQVDGYPPLAGQPELQAIVRKVSPDYFKTLGMSLVRGRVFTEQDTPTTGDVIVIDKTLADRHWPGEDPIGKRLSYGSRPLPNTKTQERRKWEIIGVVAPVKHSSLEMPDTNATIYHLVFPVFQGRGYSQFAQMTLVLKTAGPPSQLVTPLRAAVHALDPELPAFDIKTMEARIDASMERRRTPMVLLALFAGLSLLLAAVGVYGVLAFAVGQRTQEIGVRMALGATRANILQLILRQGVRLVALGLVLGLGGYFALSTFIRKMLFSVEPTDYTALLIAPVTLALVALAACLIPARRATRVDPMVALRAE